MSVNSIRSLVEVANSLSNEKIALVDKNVQLTYGELYEKINKLAQYLTSLNLPKGSRVGIYSHKDYNKVIAILAVLSTDYVLVPITRLLKAEQVDHIVKDCNIQCIITDEQKLKVIEDIEFNGTIITDKSYNKDIVSFEEIFKCYKGEFTCSIKGHDNAVITYYDIGLDGLPKGVVMTHRNLIDCARVATNYLDICEDDVISGLLSFSFDYGLNQLFCSLYKRATFAVHTFTLPSEFFTHIIKDNVTVLALMPINITQMFDEDLRRLPSANQLQNIRVITSSGGNITDAMLTKLEERFENSNFYYMHGLSEAFRSTYLDPKQLKIRPKSIGKAIPDVDLYIVNEDGNECKPREVGELIHRGLGIYKGYWGSKEETTQRFKSIKILDKVLDLSDNLTDEIVVASGDYVYSDEEGYIYFVGRHDDMIKSSGYRFSPVEIETVVYSNIDTIKECAVFSIENSDIEEEVVLVYSGNTELSKNEILFELKKHLPTYMIPAIVVFKQNMPLLSSNRNKIDKQALKKEILLQYK
ncbi:MAG: AMP-binding protein [Campylobacteraceae bacterium]|jgi:acyl-CoA synthetase (AMP-forming)/AMP-acid ligase II|nr:AMP-binding protein [Campylobacteraceae bacterium]MBT3883017.1 AMP-binding protein [Campylobacteraceae bacterium]MBT4030677.1 AMP-binding protein [Campylobacteraceae bacterium]MBT4179372.1 AMP-binding protein [Campylobacteraceae bacterium]MBT4572648.1 AMP-binding protein [Campylobacteraceae bacterium]